MWAMRTTPTEEGRRRYGNAYRSYEYFTHLHLTASNPPKDPTLPCPKNAASCKGRSFSGDTTGGGFQQLTWHALYLLQFETVLLLVDPAISGLPYVNWAASSKDLKAWYELAGIPTCSNTSNAGYEPLHLRCFLDRRTSLAVWSSTSFRPLAV